MSLRAFLVSLALVAMSVPGLAWFGTEVPAWVVAVLTCSLVALVLLVARWFRGRSR